MHSSLADIQINLIHSSLCLQKPFDDPLVINFEMVSVGIFCLKWLFWLAEMLQKCCNKQASESPIFVSYIIVVFQCQLCLLQSAICCYSYLSFQEMFANIAPANKC